MPSPHGVSSRGARHCPPVGASPLEMGWSCSRLRSSQANRQGESAPPRRNERFSWLVCYYRPADTSGPLARWGVTAEPCTARRRRGGARDHCRRQARRPDSLASPWHSTEPRQPARSRCSSLSTVGPYCRRWLAVVVLRLGQVGLWGEIGVLGGQPNTAGQGGAVVLLFPSEEEAVIGSECQNLAPLGSRAPRV